MGLFVTTNTNNNANTKPFKCAGRALLLVAAALLATGCANKPAFKPADIFEQAMNVQKQEQGSKTAQIPAVSAHTQDRNSTDTRASIPLIAPASDNRLEWQFAESRHDISPQQRRELFGLLQHAGALADYRLTIEIGPDWLSSYKRGNNLRPLVPRGLSIQQHYRAQMAPHSLVLTLEQQHNEVRYEQ